MCTIYYRQAGFGEWVLTLKTPDFRFRHVYPLASGLDLDKSCNILIMAVDTAISVKQE
jgi:hypothetical protein